MKGFATLACLCAMTVTAAAMPVGAPARSDLPVVKAEVVVKKTVRRAPVVHRRVVKKTVIR